MKIKKYYSIGFILFLSIAFQLSGCVARVPAPKVSAQHLWPCPPLLNCVSTEGLLVYYTSPFNIKGGILKSDILENETASHDSVAKEKVWEQVRNAVDDLPRTKILFSNDVYIRARSHTQVFHFVDYLEVLYDEEDQTLNVRSVSLLGIFDFGVNRLRVYQLRKLLRDAGVID